MIICFLLITFPGISVYAETYGTTIQSLSVSGDKYVNVEQKIQASAQSVSQPVYKFLVRNLADGKWETIANYSESNIISWIPKVEGEYQIGVHVRDKDSLNWLDMDRYVFISVEKIPTPVISSLTVSGNNIVNSSNVISASAVGKENLYKFLVRHSEDISWTTVQDYAQNNSFEWIPQKTGNYQIGVHVKNKYSNNWVDRDRYTNISIINLPKATIKKFTVSGGNYSGATQTIVADGSSMNNPMYKFLVRNLNGGSWETLQDYSFNNTFSWTPLKAGSYQFGLHIKDEKSKNWLDQDRYLTKVYSNPPSSHLSSIVINGKPYPDEQMLISATGTSANENYFKFLIRNLTDGKWETVQDYSSKADFEWTPKSKGTYQIGVHIKDKYSSNWLDHDGYKTVNILDLPKASITQFLVTGENHAGAIQTIEAAGTSVNRPMYKFLVRNQNDGKWITIQDYSYNNKITWLPEKAGKYQFGMHIKDEKSTNWLDSDRYTTKDITAPPLGKATGLVITGPVYIGGKQSINASGVSTNNTLYKFLVKHSTESSWTTISDYSFKDTFEWIPEKAGVYNIGIHVKDQYSTNWLDQDRYITKKFEYPPTAKINSLIISGPSYVGSNQVISVSSSSVNEPYHKFMVRRFEDSQWGQWTNLNDYTAENTLNWKPDVSGTYQIGVHVKDRYSNRWLDSDRYIEKVFLGTLTYKNTYYDITLAEALAKQLNKTPKTDLYGPDTNGNYWQDAKEADVLTYLNPLNFVTDNNVQTINKVRVNSSTLNVRTGYSTSYPIIGTASIGEVYQVISEQFGWYKISFENSVGWISGSYADLLPEYRSIQSFSNSMYQFMDISSISGLSVDMINNELIGKGILAGKGQTFYNAARQYGISEIYLLAHVLLETGNGKSELSNGIMVDTVDGKMVEPRIVYNVFGIGAVDASAIKSGSEYAYKQGWFSIEQAITGGVKWISDNYVHSTLYKQNTIYKMRWNPNNPGVHQYATDIGWALKQTRNMSLVMEIAQKNNMPVRFDVPVYLIK